ALARAREMVAEGAAVIDVGGESTRPGAEPVPVAEELRRVLPVVEALAAELPVPVSVDTSKPEVMRAAAAAGAGLINDVRALRRPGALEAAAETGLPVCLMHMRGEPRDMQRDPRYGDVVAEVGAFLEERIRACEAAGIPRDRLLVDPGFGFGKTAAHNLALLRRLDELAALGPPLLVGLSRKSLIGQLLGLPVGERLHPSVALALLAAQRGARLLRVHDVGPTVQALRTWEAVEGRAPLESPPA
ncbi:MAG: dihydropteroate synthase, partial [Gammaproteobacteria bacterium]